MCIKRMIKDEPSEQRRHIGCTCHTGSGRRDPSVAEVMSQIVRCFVSLLMGAASTGSQRTPLPGRRRSRLSAFNISVSLALSASESRIKSSRVDPLAQTAADAPQKRITYLLHLGSRHHSSSPSLLVTRRDVRALSLRSLSLPRFPMGWCLP